MAENIRWSYKTVHYELKKEGILGGIFFDESEVEESLNEFGKAGWELVSIMEIHGGLIAIFKQPINVSLSHVEEREQEIIAPQKELDDEDFLSEEVVLEEIIAETIADTDESHNNDDGVGTIKIE